MSIGVTVATRVTYAAPGGFRFAADIDAEGQVTAGYIGDDPPSSAIDAGDLPAAFFQAIADAAIALGKL